MLIFIRGEDSFLAREAILAIKQKYRHKNPDGVELIEIDAEQPITSWADLKAVPLFASSRLIIIKRASELPIVEQDNLASILTDLPASSVVVVWDGQPFKAEGALSQICHKATKIISAKSLEGLALKSWLKAQAAVLGIEVTAKQIEQRIDQYGSDLWAIQTDLKTRQGLASISVRGRAPTEKPFALFDYVRAGKWSELKKHLVASFNRGEAVEMIIGGLAAAVRKNVPDQERRRKMTDILSEIDLALKSGLIEPGDAIALLASYLPDGQKRVQWEQVWQSLA